MSDRSGACKKCFFGIRIFLRLDGPLPMVLRDILVVLGTSGKVSFTKNTFYNFLEVFKKKKKFFFIANRCGTVMVMARAKKVYKSEGKLIEHTHEKRGEWESLPSIAIVRVYVIGPLGSFIFHSPPSLSLLLRDGHACLAIVCGRE